MLPNKGGILPEIERPKVLHKKLNKKHYFYKFEQTEKPEIYFPFITENPNKNTNSPKFKAHFHKSKTENFAKKNQKTKV